jgi:hypothetical protein
MLVAPAMLRESFSHLMSGFHAGRFDRSYASSQKMKSWIGKATNEKGHAFNKLVLTRMQELGWEAQADVRVTRLLRKRFTRDYGDADVLAWNRKTGRVLVIECKNLQFSKTHGEIAEQISDFRGELDDAGKPDLLRKHLDRVEIIRAHSAQVATFCSISEKLTIEAFVVFRNPVPMQFVSDRLAHLVQISIFDDLQKILSAS